MEFIAHFFRPLHPECYKPARVSPSGRRLQIFIPFVAFISKVFLSSTYSFNRFLFFFLILKLTVHPVATLSSFCGYRFPLSVGSSALNTNRAICMAADQYQKIQGAPSVCDTPATFEVRKTGVPERGLPVWCLLHVCGSIDTEGILCSTRCSLQVECHGGFLISAPMETSPSLGMRGCTVVTVFLESLWDANHKISDFTQSHCTCRLPEHANILSVI